MILSRPPFSPSHRFPMSIGLAHNIALQDIARNFNEMLARRGEPPPLPHHLIPEWEWQWQNICFALSRFEAVFQRRYEVWRRKGYYWLEKRERELWREYDRRMRLSADATKPAESARDVQRWFNAEHDAIERERRQREAANVRRGSQRLRERWAREQARRAKARQNRWARRMRDCAAAVRRGLETPPAPGQRRRAGAPIRRLCRSSVNPAPSPETLAEAFAAARGRGRVEEKLRCGSLLLDLEASVDSSLVRTATGEIVGRKPGLRGWLGDHLPLLLNHYASLMQYRRMAQAFREAHGLRDPYPASVLLSDEAPRLFPPPQRARLAAARADAKALLASATGRTMKDLRQALARREWRRTG